MIRILVFTLVFMLASCATTSESTSLYKQLGGREGLENIVDDFIQNIAGDEQVFHYFAEANVTYFRQGFIQHICDLSSGPCEYQGDNMVDIHTGMNISEADFNRIVELLVNALNENNIDYTTQNRLLAILAPMREDIYKR